MKFVIVLLMLSTQTSFATTYFCVSQNPHGAIAIDLNEAGKSVGRQSNPFTGQLEDILGTDKGAYNKLNVGNVEKTKDGYKFNASVYGLVNHPDVIRLTKSEIKKNKLSFFIEVDRYMEMDCTIKKVSL
jgi:hypothetical protein